MKRDQEGVHLASRKLLCTVEQTKIFLSRVSHLPAFFFLHALSLPCAAPPDPYRI